jgi:electron transfer flavoprotein beta subunit
MRIAVLVHPVRRAPDASETLDGLAPGDRAALGAALRLADESSFEVVALSAGPTAAESPLLRAIAGGAPRALRVWSADVHRDDYWAVSRLLAAALRRVGFDLVFAGDRSTNWGSGMIGPALAQQLELPHLSGALRASYRDGELDVSLARGTECRVCRVPLPALITFRADRDAAARSLASATHDVVAAPTLDVLDLTERNPTGKAKLVSRAVQEATPSRCELLADAAALCAKLRDQGLLR